jgi:hypothetical protein
MSDWLVRLCPNPGCSYDKFHIRQLRAAPYTIRFICAGCEVPLGDVGPPPEAQAPGVVGGRLQP